MKSFTLLTLFSMLSTNFQNDASLTNAPEHTGSEVIGALKHMSAEKYAALIPTLNEFHQIMHKNERIYGGFLAEAKREFSSRYEHELIPSVKEAFNTLIAEGVKRGIDWKNVAFVRVNALEIQDQASLAQLDIVFSENGKEFTVRVENAFIWEGDWKVTQFIHFV